MTTATAAARPAQPGRGVGHILLLVFGSILGLVALALVLGGGALVWADQTQRDADGYFTTPAERVESDAYAITHEGLEIGDVSETPDWIVDRLGTIRVRASGGSAGELFVGIGPAADVARYLAGVGHDEITSIGLDPFSEELRTTPGGAPRAAPGDQTFWAASASGGHTQTVTRGTSTVAPGRWS